MVHITDMMDPGPKVGGPPRLTCRLIDHLTETRTGRRRLTAMEPVLLRAEQAARELDPVLAWKLGQLRAVIAAALRGEPV